jgi:hypothetical protein
MSESQTVEKGFNESAGGLLCGNSQLSMTDELPSKSTHLFILHYECGHNIT